MFGEGNTVRPIGPRNRGRWVGLAVGCLLLATAVVLVSGTVDGLNFFGRRLPDTTPSFSDPPREPATDKDSSVVATPGKSATKDDARSPARFRSLTSTQLSKPAVSSAQSSKAPPIPAQPPSATPASSTQSPRPLGAPPVGLKMGTSEAAVPKPPPCARSGHAAVLQPVDEPIGSALARSLTSSDPSMRIIEFNNNGFRREDADRILAGETPPALGQIREGTLLVAQLRTQERRTIIDEAPMTEVAGTMDLAIVRNNCGTIAIERHRDVRGRSVNEKLDDGIRGLGEIFKEKIIEFMKSAEAPGKNR